MSTPFKPARATKARIILAFAAIYLIWGSTYLAIRFAIETMPPFLMAGARFLISGILLYTIAARISSVKPTLKDWKCATIVGAFLLLGGNGGVVWAEQYVPSGLASIFIATVPLWMVLLNWVAFDRNKPSGAIISGIILGFLGVWLLMGPGPTGEAIHLSGALVLLLAAFLWAIGSLYSRIVNLKTSALLTIAMEMIGGSLFLLLASFLAGEWTQINILAFSAQSLLSFIYLILFGSLVGFTAYLWLLKTVSPSKVSTYAYVNPVVALFLGWAFAGEMLFLRTFFAAAIIILAVIVINIYQEKIELVK